MQWTLGRQKTAACHRDMPEALQGASTLPSVSNLRRSTELLGETERLVHIGERENDIYEIFTRRLPLVGNASEDG